MGNTNFSIILPRLLFTRNHGAELVARAVRERLGLPNCGVNERNDVVIHDPKLDRDFKMSLFPRYFQEPRVKYRGTCADELGYLRLRLGL